MPPSRDLSGRCAALARARAAALARVHGAARAAAGLASLGSLPPGRVHVRRRECARARPLFHGHAASLAGQGQGMYQAWSWLWCVRWFMGCERREAALFIPEAPAPMHPCRLWVRAPVPACGCGVESDVLISRGDVSRLTAQALKPKCPMQLGNYVLASTEFESCRVVGNIPASFFLLYATGNFHGDLPSRTTARAHSAHRAPMNDLFRFLSPPQL